MIDRQKLAKMQDQGFTKEEIAGQMGIEPRAVARVATLMGRSFEEMDRRSCITCKKQTANRFRRICYRCRENHRDRGLKQVETYSVPGVNL